MNWTDFVVVALILAFGIIGLSRGFIFSIFKLASFFISLFVSVKCYPVVAKILNATTIDDTIGKWVKNALMLQQAAGAQSGNEAGKAAANSVVQGLRLPSFLKNDILAHIPDPSKIIPLDRITDIVSKQITGVVINIISLILLYIAVRIGLIFAGFIFMGIARLPVFRQIDKLGGFAFGAVEGLLSIYILMAVLMLFSSAPKLKTVFEAVNMSVIAKFFFENNFIINWMF